MNKRFSTLLIILAAFILILSLFATPLYSTASAASEQFVRLVGAKFIPGKGVQFTFEYKGSFDAFSGSVLVGGKSAALNCHVASETGSAKSGSLKGVVTCIASGIGQRFVGSQAQTNLNGYAGNTKIADATYCAPIFDYSPTEGTAVWSQQGVYCQDQAFQWGDEIYYFNPTWDDSYFYYYRNNGDEGCIIAPQLGRGFYYDADICSF